MLTVLKMKNDFFLVKELSGEEMTDSGIYISEKYPRKAKVLACGETETEVKVGDTVLRNVGRGTQININGEDLEMIHKDFIMAVLSSS